MPENVITSSDDAQLLRSSPMKYLVIPKKVTVVLLRKPDGSPGEVDFASWLDSYLFPWNGWRSREQLRNLAGAIYTKLCDESTFKKGEDGRSVTHVLDEGRVIELTDKEHEALCTAVDGCEIPPTIQMSLMPFTNAVHGALSDDPRTKATEKKVRAA
jgi:hypothetical protein